MRDVRPFERAVGRDPHHRRPRADACGRELADGVEHTVGVVERAELLRRLEQRPQPGAARLFGGEQRAALVDVDTDSGRADDHTSCVVDRFAAAFEPVHTSVAPDDAVIETPRDVAGHAVVHRRDREITVVGMEQRPVHRHRAVERAGLEPVQRFELFVPVDLARHQVPPPRSHAPRGQREPESLRVHCLRARDLELGLPPLADERQHGRGDHGDGDHPHTGEVLVGEEDAVDLPELERQRDRVEAHDGHLDQRRADRRDQRTDQHAHEEHVAVADQVEQSDGRRGEQACQQPETGAVTSTSGRGDLPREGDHRPDGSDAPSIGPVRLPSPTGCAQ